MDYSRTLLYAEGLFETILWKGENKKIKRHYERLLKSAIYFDLPYPSYEDFISHIKDVAGIEEGIYIKYCLLSQGEMLFYDKSKSFNYKVIKAPLPKTPTKVTLTFSPFKYHSENPIIYHKTMNYLFNITVKRDALKRGFYDGIIKNEKECVCECSTSNILIYDGKTLITPKRESGLLFGTTLQCLIENLDIKEQQINTHDLLDAKSIYILNSIIGVLPVIAIDKKSYKIDKIILNECRNVLSKEN